MITITHSAAVAVARFVRSSSTPEGGVRISVVDGGCSGLQYKLSVVPAAQDNDLVLSEGDAKVFVDADSNELLSGVTVDFIDGLEGTGFKFQNPNAKAACGCGKSFSC